MTKINKTKQFLDFEKLIKVESYLPIFQGFYNSIFDAVDTDCEDGNEDNTQEWDYREYYSRIAKHLVGFIGGELKAFGVSVKFTELHNPKEYNFNNDIIFVDYTISLENVGKLNDYLIEHMDAFKLYLKRRYSSYDGFRSYHSTNAEEWLSILNQDDVTLLEHKLGSMFHFYLENEDDMDMDTLYESCLDSGEIYVNPV